MTENATVSEPVYEGAIHNVGRQMIHVSPKKTYETRLRRFIYDNCKKVVLRLFREAILWAWNIVLTFIY